MFWLWGALGAFVLSVNAYTFALWDNGRRRSRRIKATADFIAALLTGAIFAEGLTHTAQVIVSPWFHVEGVAMALTIGWSSNYLWPKVLRKLGAWVQQFDTKEPM